MSLILFLFVIARQQSLVRGYLPPSSNPERPRPFEMPTTQKPYNPTISTGVVYNGGNNLGFGQPGPFSSSVSTGYPYLGSTPQPSFPIGSTPSAVPTFDTKPPYRPSTGFPSIPPSDALSTPQVPYQPERPQTSQPALPPYKPQPGYTASQPSYTSSQPSSPTYTTFKPSQPSQPAQPSQPSQPPQPSSPTYTSAQPSFPTYTSSPTPSISSPGYQPPGTRPFPTSPPSSLEPFPTSPAQPSQPLDDNHPPHIHALDVECAKDMMTINVEFNRQYDGIIYSKGFFNNPECRYVQANSGQTKYSFTVSLNSCGTEFINGFDTQGQSYLENVLVLQNEPGIQEVWDTIRSVRCLWEGNINKALSIPLSVGMLNQEIVTFSGDTAMASLEIQQGRGPFAGPANGLVKIGEIMTLVVSITGDPGFDIRVRDCRARDSDSQNIIMLTDTNGCVLKPKLFGAFQKTRQTQNTGASIIAYAYFSAFKFPDMMDLIMECNVELCKTDCEMCPVPGQKTEPGRRRRDLYSNISNQTFAEPITVARGLRVILPQDLGLDEDKFDSVCVSFIGFAVISGLALSLLSILSVIASYYWIKYRNLRGKH